MRKGIGPRGLGAPKSAAKMMKSPGKMMKSPAKKDGEPTKKPLPKNTAGFMKPAQTKGSFQEFVNDGPAPFIRGGYNKAKKAVKKVAGKTYGTSI